MRTQLHAGTRRLTSCTWNVRKNFGVAVDYHYWSAKGSFFSDKRCSCMHQPPKEEVSLFRTGALALGKRWESDGILQRANHGCNIKANCVVKIRLWQTVTSRGWSLQHERVAWAWRVGGLGSHQLYPSRTAFETSRNIFEILDLADKDDLQSPTCPSLQTEQAEPWGQCSCW